MVSAEKRKYDRVKMLRARDIKADMMAGNKASEINSEETDSTGSQVLVEDPENIPQGPDNNHAGQIKPTPETSTAQVPNAIETSGTPTQIIFTTTYVVTSDIINADQNTRIIFTTTEVRTKTPEAQTIQTNTNTISQSAPKESENSNIASEASSSGGLSNGAKIGIGVAVPIVFILLGLGIFFFFRRKKQQRLANKEGGVGEVMITGGKHHDEDGSSGGVAGSPMAYHPNVTPPGAVPGAAPVPMGAPAPRSRTQEEEDDLMNRPVSPVHDDDLLTGEAGSSHSVTRSGTALGGSVRDRGSPSLDDDREMQWILEEERKAKERREQQGRLPTHT